jgi:hypothetical protein
MAKVNPVSIVRNGIAKMPPAHLTAEEPELSRLSGVFSIFRMASRTPVCTCGTPNDRHMGMCPSRSARVSFTKSTHDKIMQRNIPDALPFTQACSSLERKFEEQQHPKKEQTQTDSQMVKRAAKLLEKLQRRPSRYTKYTIDIGESALLTDCASGRAPM